MKKPTIKFSHNYKKLNVLGNGSTAKLLTVLDVNLRDLAQPFLDYDTDNGVFKLPKSGNYLLLIFKAEKGIFTTLRSAWPLTKYAYYHNSVGKEFEVLVNKVL